MTAIFIILAGVASVVWGSFSEMSEQRRLRSMAEDVRRRA